MRIGRADDFAVVNCEIEKLERGAAELEAERERLEAGLREALARDAADFEEREVRGLRHELGSVGERAGLAADRVAALKARLPSAEERKAAGAEARGLLKSSEAEAKSLGVAWAELSEALAAAEDAAGKARAARRESRRLLARLEDLVAHHGLDVAVPRPPKEPDAKVAHLVGLMLSQAAFGEPDDVVVRDLAAARRAKAS